MMITLTGRNMLKSNAWFVVALTAGVILAAPSLQAQKRGGGGRYLDAPVAAMVQQITTSGEQVVLKIGSETLTVPRQRLTVFDTRGDRHRTSRASLKPGTPVIFEARRGRDGSVRRLRVVIFDSIESANAAVGKVAGR